MHILDYRDLSLASRIHAADHLRDAEPILTDAEDVLVDLGSNLATTSWVDGFLVPMARTLGSRSITIVSDSDLTRAHLARVFSSRGLTARVSRTRNDALDGRFDTVPR